MNQVNELSFPLRKEDGTRAVSGAMRAVADCGEAGVEAALRKNSARFFLKSKRKRGLARASKKRESRTP